MGDREWERERYRQKLIGRQKRKPREDRAKPKKQRQKTVIPKKILKGAAACLPFLLLAAIATALLFGGKQKIADGEAHFYFFDVGQADAAVVMTRDSCILIDAGSNSSAAHLTEKLRAAGVERIDLAIFSHAHEDHIGGGDSVIDEFEVDRILMPQSETYSATLDRLCSAAERKGVTIDYTEAVGTLTVGELTVDILPTLPNTEDENEASAIIKVRYGNTAAIYTGDAGAESEQYLLSALGRDALDCDILKVGHHGSDTSSCSEWIDALSPAFAVISCQRGNEYGHPSYNVLRRLQNVGATVCRTDRDGSILLISDGNEIRPAEAGDNK